MPLHKNMDQKFIITKMTDIGNRVWIDIWCNETPYRGAYISVFEWDKGKRECRPNISIGQNESLEGLARLAAFFAKAYAIMLSVEPLESWVNHEQADSKPAGN